ncbi:hypothetical protein ZWY2020_059287 [Hordeum vulgare]|nr:hypothetical protein ZWY2020_059287 [Hordeum vulgare]
MHHARDAKHCGRPLAHRALAAVVCRVLGWDVKQLHSIVIDPRGMLGQALLASDAARFVEKVDPTEGPVADSSNADSGTNRVASQEGYSPWKEELECLVRGGLPMALRGELWQAFVGMELGE